MAFCMNCGTQLPDGAAFCMSCGTKLGRVPAGGSTTAQPGGFTQPQPGGFVPAQQAMPAGGKKSRKGLIIGLAAGGTVLVAGLVILILFLTGVIGGGSKEGLYKTTDGDVSYYIQLNSGGSAMLYEFSEYYYDEYAATWTDTTLSAMGVTMQMTFSGNKLTLTYGAEQLFFEKTDEPLPKRTDVEPLDEKPVIYLYPEEETKVSLRLDYAGALTTVYPSFDAENTWQVTARPDGTFFGADGREYYCLFWEGVNGFTPDFSEGFVIRGEDTAAFLEEALAAQGLSTREANEFIIYWLPRMEGNEWNLISFQGENYTDAAKLFVDPLPDTVIRVFMSFRPLSEDEAQALQDTLPAQTFITPQREGFTLVEWGGNEVR
ncbi:MAG: zinc ribbon domain-containing protein [Lachnospiraceae bacterium]|nr:zinc ribbon domain-containing protein [Lachnospiraceae bacterium]